MVSDANVQNVNFNSFIGGSIELLSMIGGLSADNSTIPIDYEIVENVVFEIHNVENSDCSIRLPQKSETVDENMGECRNTDEEGNMTLCTYCGIFSPNLEENVSSIHGSDHSEYSVLENGQKNSKYSTFLCFLQNIANQACQAFGEKTSSGTSSPESTALQVCKYR
ncbi:hypothetical protein JTB14_026218 [Gonioctena quinquepunctata]|nr:hypothetical protein JTB14_026218 [Gonioctena quinquepunctata]